MKPYKKAASAATRILNSMVINYPYMQLQHYCWSLFGLKHLTSVVFKDFFPQVNHMPTIPKLNTCCFSQLQ